MVSAKSKSSGKRTNSSVRKQRIQEAERRLNAPDRPRREVEDPGVCPEC